MKFSIKNIDSLDDDDLTQVKALDQKFFPFPWSHKQWDELNDNDRLFILKDDMDLVGFSLFRVEVDVFHLLKVLIAPELQSKNYAHQLMKDSYYALVKEAGNERNVFLEVQEGNLKAIRFYERIGLEKGERIKNYYSDGSVALRYFGKPKFT
ncbi:MAG: GNAT family N-acetyltransferase [Oligoflexia bacterium]|nr:GNAT family N-acetyltransferase [Oligoflexia bacterium]